MYQPKHDRSIRPRICSAIVGVCIFIAQCLPASAQSANDLRSSLPGSLNLGSARRITRAPDSLTSPVSIVTGGRLREVTASMPLTAAQALAVAQVLESGTHSIVLGPRGNAIGGSVDISAVQNITSLAVPRGVTVVRDFGIAPPLELKGNLVNSGAFYAVSTNTAVNNAVMSAENMRNNFGAVITSILPSTGLPGITNGITNLSLSLIAADSIFNAGTISSAGNLNLIAGHQIVNATPGDGSVLSALASVNIATQNLVNAGMIQAGSNINIAEQIIRNSELAALSTQLTQAQTAFDVLSSVRNLRITNVGGVLQALGSSINFDDANAKHGLFLTVVGGDLLSHEVNVDAGAGDFDLFVNNLPGTLNVKAGDAHAGSSSNLTLGEMKISGDPTFFSDQDMILTGNLTANEPITLIAAGDISLGTFTVDSSVSTSQGNNITMVAGAEFVVSGASSTASDPPFQLLLTPTRQLDTLTLKVTGPSATGGNITCSGCTIDAHSTGSGQNGGNVLLAAFSGPAPFGTGIISLLNNGGSDPALIDTSTTDSTGLRAGNVTVIAPNSIQLDTITMVGKTGKPLSMVTNAQPTGTLTADFHGVAKGSLKAGSVNTAGGYLELGDTVSAPGATVVMKAGAADLSMLPTASIDVSVTVPGTKKAGTITLTSLADARLAGDITANGAPGVTGADGISPGAAGSTGGKGGSAGAVAVTADRILDEPMNPVGIFVIGGMGGAGGDGAASASAQQAGGRGGNGGAGGKAGKVTLKADDIELGVGGSIIVVIWGGQGGSGGSGRDGSGGSSGGTGGNGGTGGKSGSVLLQGNSIDIKGGVLSLGGFGGLNGSGGTSQSISSGVGGPAGTAGSLGNGSQGGKITMKVGDDHLFIDSNAFISAQGGAGVCFLCIPNSGGIGGSSVETGGVGGTGGSGGIGGVGGSIKISSKAPINQFFGELTVEGGPGGPGTTGGKGGFGLSFGGTGGIGGNGGPGGKAGKLSITSSVGSITGNSITSLSAKGGDGGDGGAGGAGGNTIGTNGSGGQGGNGGNGNNGGTVTTSPVITGLDTASQVDVSGGSGGGVGAGGGVGTGGGGGTTGAPGSTAGSDGLPGQGPFSYALPDSNAVDPMWKKSKRRGTYVPLTAKVARDSDGQDSTYRTVAFTGPTFMMSEKDVPASNVLLAPESENVTVGVGIASVRVAKGAAAFVVNSGRDISVLSLHERAMGDVSVSINGRVIDLRVGEQVVITGSRTLVFGEVNAVPAVACRDIKERILDDGKRVFISQFSIASAMDNLKSLKQLSRSSDAHLRATFKKVLKNAAILHIVTAGRGPYKTSSKPAVTTKAI